MSRLCHAAVIASALCAALALPRAAHAADADSDSPSHASQPVAAGDGACTEAGEMMPARALTVGLEDALPAGESTVPWCMTPDDPRCSPMEGGSVPPQVSAQARLALTKTTSTGEPSGRDCSPPPMAADGKALDGAQVRLERPPRAHALSA